MAGADSGLKKLVLLLGELKETFLLGFSVLNTESDCVGMSTFLFPLSNKPSFEITNKIPYLDLLVVACKMLSLRFSSFKEFCDVAVLSDLILTDFNAEDFSGVLLLWLPEMAGR